MWNNQTPPSSVNVNTTRIFISAVHTPLQICLPAGRPARPRTQHDCHHDTKVKPEAATAVIELLMMGGKMAETCWAVNKRQDNKLENCCIWLMIYLNSNSYFGILVHLLPGSPGRLRLLHVIREPIRCQVEDPCLLRYCLLTTGCRLFWGTTLCDVGACVPVNTV